MAGRPRLKKGDISIREMLEVSYSVYGKQADNKKYRADVDIVGAKLTYVNNLEKKKGKWIQTGRNYKLLVVVRSKPTSYKKNDTVNIHRYPVVFLIRNLEEGINSSFRWRTGSFKIWKNPTQKISEGKTEREKNQIRRENLRIRNENIRNGLQGAFIFENMWVNNAYGMLYGPLTCLNKPPKIKNKDYVPYFDKTALYVCEKIVIPLLDNIDMLKNDDNIKV